MKVEDKKAKPQYVPHKKLKVVWLCYFSNEFVQNQLKPFKRIGEIAPWISSLIKLFENNIDIELHIISQHEWITGYKSFEKNGVFYHFFNNGIPFTGRHWPSFLRFDLWIDFFPLKKKFASIVNKIQPDIIHMHGAENEFCTGIIQFHRKFPVFITIQGFIHKSSSISKSIKRRIQNEFKILNLFNHYGYRTETMGKDIKNLNPKAVLH